MHQAFSYTHYILKRQVFALTGKVRIYSPENNLLLFSEQKMFRLREDIRVFSDESKTQEVLRIQARQIIDFSAAYDVVDPAENLVVGTLRRKGLKSLVRDEWEVLVPGSQAGVLQEDSVAQALLRRLLLGSFLPQNYDLLIGSGRAADLRQRFSFFGYTMDIDLSPTPGAAIDPRLALAAGILLAIIEGKQDS